MWSLGKVFQTPEVVRVYIGSFWDKPYQLKDNQKLFEAEQTDLLKVFISIYFIIIIVSHFFFINFFIKFILLLFLFD